MRKGFTLIELLVVISIISLLSTVVLASVTTARAKARDAVRMAALTQIRTAMNLYYDANGVFPPNPISNNSVCDSQGGWTSLMGPLVTAGFLSSIPHDPGSPNNLYCYYNYGANNTVGALIQGTLEAAPPSVMGYTGTCRPWLAGQNWCDQSSDREYCLCNTY
jgi:prepilin-type N-terminal cleavage/methylation domain-containing protein